MTEVLPTIEATRTLADLEQVHGQVKRVPDRVPQADQLLSLCPTGTRVYMCQNCDAIFTIEADGEIRLWHWDADNTPYSFGREDFDDDA